MEGRIIKRVLEGNDLVIASCMAAATVKGETDQTLVRRDMTDFVAIYKAGNGFAVFMEDNEGVHILGHAAIPHSEPIVHEVGSRKIHVYEVGSVLGNGHASEAVVRLVRARRNPLRRLREGRLFQREQYIAVVREDNEKSNRLFANKIGRTRLMPREEVPAQIYDEPVGYDEGSRNFNVYDVTHARRIKRKRTTTSQKAI